MREFRTYGSVRGALSNGRPYRVQKFPLKFRGRQSVANIRICATDRSSTGSLSTQAIVPLWFHDVPLWQRGPPNLRTQHSVCRKSM